MLYCDKHEQSIENSSYKILIVEDSEFVNNSINKILVDKGYVCKQAFDYAVASHNLVNSKYDFIILDLNLPDAYGEKLVLEVKRLSKAKIIILTTETDIQTRENLFKNGILDYLVKDKYFNNSIAAIDQVIHSIEKNYSSNILVVDDSKLIRKHIESILNVRNYNIVEAEDAEQAFEQLKVSTINLILLDMELPGKHGLDIIREIKSIPEKYSIPIIVISGKSDPELVRSSLKLGASDFIKKPFNIEEFVLKVDTAIESNRKSREILCKQQLLNEYKDAVDRSTIVSKTDLKGNITYVNDKFCELSGYSESTLIGKQYNLIRHKDMSSEVFKELWKTIKNKESWFGIVKNRKKNGEAYYIDTVISPIVDYDGNIVEYIGIGTDITTIETMKEHLEDELNISEGNFQEMYKRSSEYEKAIDVSNILSRSNVDGTITYVNQAFCDISGYTEEELIGNSHNMLNHPEIAPSLYKNIWDTILSGNSWNGGIRHVAKDGSTYHVHSTIVPIKDADDNTIEHMFISHNMTEFVKLHTELEETQKEIIHRMGEVGETRSKETGFHVKRVAEYSKLLALLSGLGEKNAELLYSASPMHDIGKVGIPDKILLKPGRLDEEEWKIMKTHSKLGYNILKKSKRRILKAAAIVAFTHHERWDGKGYPNKIVGEKIHIFGRITAIADVFDALGSDRSYKEAWELDRILELFKEEREKHFDPKLLDIFLENIEKFLKIRDKFQDKV
ncbi:response regulator [Sulfurimonas sp.]|uniref:response regulator n=1 Tax=Sulfurimonas sp. TaxID=2022749 RepID=UPI002B49D387|nr:response regulator [Sulfurimonas sp.]